MDEHDRDRYQRHRLRSQVWECERCGFVVTIWSKREDAPPSEHCRRCKVPDDDSQAMRRR